MCLYIDNVILFLQNPNESLNQDIKLFNSILPIYGDGDFAVPATKSKASLQGRQYHLRW